MKKIFSVFLIIPILLMCAGCGEDEGITGNEWLYKQENCLKDMQAFAASMDDVFTYYIMGSISQEDFMAEIELLKKQYDVLCGLYNQLKADNPIKPESHSYLSKRGSDAMENLYGCFGEILNNATDENGKLLAPGPLAYIYLAYRQNITDYLSEYITALALVRGVENGEFDDISFDFSDISISESEPEGSSQIDS